MTSLTSDRELLERALSNARTRYQERAIGSQICRIMVLQEHRERGQTFVMKRTQYRRGLSFCVDVWQAAA